MAESVDCSDFCRLCLVKEQVNTPIFEELGDLQQIYIKITACLPIKVSLEDPLPKRICDECSYKLDQQYNFWNTSINAEKQLRQWLGLPEEPPTKSENVVSGKIKREKDNYESPSKRPRRNARRKAAQHVRQAAAAAIAASDSGPGEDMDLDAFTKEENDSDNDFHDNNESMEDSTYANVGLDSEEHGEAGPSGLQKGAVTSTNSGTDAGGPGILIKEEDIEVQIKQEECDEFTPPEDHINNCEYCPKSFSTKTQLMSHMLCHTTDRPHKCDVCNKTYKRISQLNIHKRIHDKNREKFICSTCLREFTSKQYLDEHEKQHKGITHNCDQCDQTFKSKYQLKHHVDAKHNFIRYQCGKCTKSFLTKDNLLRHSRTHDPNYVAEVLTCEVCGKTCTSRTDYCRHVRSHEGFSCDQCGQIFKYAERLKYHMYTHTGEKPYACTYCEKRFRLKEYLTEHLRTHTKERPFVCSDCGKGFTQRSSMKIHMRSHTGERPFACTLCTEAFISKHRLSLHLNKTHCLTK